MTEYFFHVRYAIHEFALIVLSVLFGISICGVNSIGGRNLSKEKGNSRGDFMFRTLRGIVTKSQGLFQQFSVIPYLIRTTSLKHTFKIFNLLLLVASLTGTMLASSSMAQNRSSLSEEDKREDHVLDAMKWLEDFRNPMHEANYDSLRQIGYEQLKQMDNRPAMKALSSAAWVEVGTSQDSHVSGRGSCIAFAKSGAIYYGVTKGGFWKTTDNGTDWVSLSDTWSMLDIGGAAVDPTNDNIIYAGTGTPTGGVGGGGDEAGVGIYKSTDAGLNWTLLPGSPKLATTQLEVNPASPNIVYYASTSGVTRSDDGGATWTGVLSMGGYTSIVLDPNNPAIIYAGGGGAIEKSIDSGKTWTALPSGYPTGPLMILGMSRVSSDTIYLSTGQGNGNIAQGGSQREVGTGSTLALSTNAGQTWTVKSSNLDYLGEQAFYANALAVNPANPSVVVAGGLDIAASTQGGTGLKLVTDWGNSSSNSDYAHADIHVLKYNPYTKVLYAMTDGGVYYSGNNGTNWSQTMNATLGTLSFVGGDMTPDGSFFCAGAQDNGLNSLTVGQDPTYKSINGGDGGTMFISPADGETIYGTYIYSTLYTSNNRGADWNGSPQNILGFGLIDTDQAPFYMEYDVCDADPGFVACCGSRNLYIEDDGNAAWPNSFPRVTNTNSSNRISGSAYRVHISSENDGYVFLGTTSNCFYASGDNGQTWTKSTSPTSFPGEPTSITNDPNNDANLCMTVGLTSSKHFYYSTDYGQTWTTPATNLPAFNYHRVTMDPNGIIYVGHDYGVLRSGDTGKTWYPVADGLPLVMITSLHVRGNYLVAGTYGRGMYYVDLTQLAPLGTNSVASAANSSSSISIGAVYPSVITISAPRSNIDYSLPGGEQATLAVYDILGREERMLVNDFATQGAHEISADFSGLAAGRHYLVLTAGGSSVTKPIIIE
jgi:photosystem II stability/assembly factor-like uncharacterized protein